MKTPGWFKRGAATAAVFLFGGSLVAGLLLSLLLTGVDALTPSLATPTGETPPWIAGMVGGMLLQALPALIVGVGMSLVSPRIRTTRAWIGWSSLANAVLVLTLVALITRGTAQADAVLAVVLVIGIGLPGSLAGVAAAVLTVKVRPGPLVAPTADVFA